MSKNIVDKQIWGIKKGEAMKSIYQHKMLLFSVLICGELFADIHDRIEHKVNRTLSEIDIINGRLSDVECTPITASMIGPDGFVISTSGSYCVPENVQWAANPANPKPIAISINASNVTLDCLGNTIEDINNVAGSVMVQVVGNNVTVKNGVFKCRSAGFVAESLLPLERLTVSNCSSTALGDDTVSAFAFINCANLTVENCFGTAITNPPTDTLYVSPAYAYTFVACSNGALKNCSASALSSKTEASGYEMIGCSNFVVQNCFATATGAQTTCGFLLSYCPQMLFENCIATNINGLCADAHGFAIYLECHNSDFRGCIATGVTSAGVDGYGEKGDGFELYTSRNVTFTDCIAQDITAINSARHSAVGFSTGATCYNTTYENCKAKNVQCIENASYKGSTPGFGYGFGPAIDPRNGSNHGTVFPQYNTVWRNCISEGNSATHLQNGLGFDLYGQINATLINCIAQGNSGYGIYNDGSRDHGPAQDFNCSTPVVVINLANDSGGYIVQDNTINGNGFGAISDTSGATSLYVGNVTFP